MEEGRAGDVQRARSIRRAGAADAPGGGRARRGRRPPAARRRRPRAGRPPRGARRPAASSAGPAQSGRTGTRRRCFAGVEEEDRVRRRRPRGARSCVMTSIATPRSRACCTRSFARRRTPSGSRPTEGPSSTRMVRPAARVRATARRWACPPLRVATLVPGRASAASRSTASSQRAGASARLPPAALRERDVAGDVEVVEERAALRDEGDGRVEPALVPRDGVAPGTEIAGRDEGLQERALAGSGGAEERDDLAGGEDEIGLCDEQGAVGEGDLQATDGEDGGRRLVGEGLLGRRLLGGRRFREELDGGGLGGRGRLDRLDGDGSGGEGRRCGRWIRGHGGILARDGGEARAGPLFDGRGCLTRWCG